MSIKNNTTDLQALLEVANNLPVAENLDTELSAQDELIAQIVGALEGKTGGGGGVELPALSNPAGAGDILSGKEAINGDGNKVSGSMANNGAVSQSLNAGGSYTIPAGYHNGSGKVTANSLASQTDATATAADIMSGKTAYVDGVKVTGTAVAKEAKSITYTAERWNGGNATWRAAAVFKTVYNGNAANPITIGTGDYFYMYQSVSTDERYRVLATVNY